VDEFSPAQCVLKATGLVKRYSGVTALSGVDIDLYPGEVHCLVGENGAGKSTLIKILSGAVRPDSGIVECFGKDLTTASIKQRRDAGISVIYQDLNLVPQLTVAENIFLGHEIVTKHGRLNKRAMIDEAQRLVDVLGVSFSPKSRVDELGISLQQLTATARALSLGGKILIMDEPSAVLGGAELEELFAVIRRLTGRGIAVIYISHRLEEIFRIGDRVTVLRDGHFVATADVSKIDQPQLIRWMVGQDVQSYRRDEVSLHGDEVLSVEHVSSKGRLYDVSLSIHKGEVLGIAGLVGAGRTELARAVMGLDAIDSGVIRIDGVPRRISSPARAMGLGLAMVPEDRRADGIIALLPVRDNVALSLVRRMSHLGVLAFKSMYARVRDLAGELAIKVPDLRDSVANLSGGNQQKVVLARCLASDCKLLILDEPTVGVDVGAKQEIYNIIGQLKKKGIGVMVISSELPEIMSISDRILVMSVGRIRGEVDPHSATQEEILDLAIPPMEELAIVGGGR